MYAYKSKKKSELQNTEYKLLNKPQSGMKIILDHIEFHLSIVFQIEHATACSY